MGKKSKSKKNKESSEAPKKTESAIHIRLENPEAIQGKRDLLSSEINLLKIFQSIEHFKRLRAEELKKKRLVLKKSGEIKKNLNKLKIILPNLKIPKILKEEVSSIKKKKKNLDFNYKIPKTKSKIEEELTEIQERLNRLSRQNP